MSARARLLPLLIVTALAASACSDGGEPAAPATSSSRTPGDPTTSWDPAAPAEPVDPAEVGSTYDVVLDAVTSAVDGQSPGLSWSGSTTRTEEFEGTCAVALERSAPGSLPHRGDDTLDLSALTAAVAEHGFSDLAMADDPGGALRYLAHGADGALFELRSKDTTTVAVRVPTTADSC